MIISLTHIKLFGKAQHSNKYFASKLTFAVSIPTFGRIYREVIHFYDGLFVLWAPLNIREKQEENMSNKTPVGSVLVVGGGIAGMQSALDLANSGYYVYLIEKSLSIGGVMSELDKTFPTNDCAM
jgi:heterodisulfide reductase subunit A